MSALDPPCEDDLPHPTSSVLQSPCPYNLRSHDCKHVITDSVGGIGELLSQGQFKNKRGRKSNLAKGKINAKFDVVDGKQQSITGVLRAVQTPENVIK